MKRFSTAMLARAGAIAALYVALTFIVLPVASGAIQFRPSEALTILPLFYVEAIPALFVGCILANLIGGCALLDIFFGSGITLIAAILTFLCGRFLRNCGWKIFVGGLFPVLLNALLLPVIWYFAYGKLEYAYILQAAFLLLSQGVVIYGLGTPLYFAVAKLAEKMPNAFGGGYLPIKKQ